MGGESNGLGEIFEDLPVVEVGDNRPAGHGDHLEVEPGSGIPSAKPYDEVLQGWGEVARNSTDDERPLAAGHGDGCGCTGQLPSNFAQG